MNLRADLKIIADLINPNARVLDLGCGTGELLAHLQSTKGVNGYGLDIDPDNIRQCISAGVNVIQQNLDEGLGNFPDDRFDMVVMTETLQAVRRPEAVLDEMLRIGRECIVTFPNFGHWSCRAHLLSKGRMPMATHLPHQWHDTPNIHLCTFADFEAFCRHKQRNIIERFVVNTNYQSGVLSNLFPNLFGSIAFYRLGR